MLDWSLAHLVDVHEVIPSMAGVSCGVFHLRGRGISLTKWLGSLPEAKAPVGLNSVTTTWYKRVVDGAQ